jgi:hypothetical protein
MESGGSVPPQLSPKPKGSKFQWFGSIPFKLIPSDHFAHHNQALDTIHEAQNRGILRGKGTSAPILIHFDSHSDIYDNRGTPHEAISDYINTLMLNGDVSEVYWVLPNWTETPEAAPAFWANTPPLPLDQEAAFIGDRRNTYTAYIYFDPITQKNALIFAKPDDFEANPTKYKTITVHKVFINELPTFVGENRQIIADIDFDYFGNNGYDTFGGEDFSQFNPSNTELLSSLTDFNTKLSLMKKPSLVLGSNSPLYTPEEDIPVISNWFAKTFGRDILPNVAGNYSHDWDANYSKGLLEKVMGFVTSGVEIPQSLIDEMSQRGYDDVQRSCILYNKAILSKIAINTVQKKLLIVINTSIQTLSGN